MEDTHHCCSPKIGKHAKAFEVKFLLGEDLWEDYFSFAFVRNPFDLMVSSYHWWLQKAPHLKHHQANAKKVAAMGDFDRFMCSRFGRHMINERYGTLYDWLAEGERCIVDYVGKMETLQADFQEICRLNHLPEVSLPHENRTQRTHYQSYYTPATRQIVENRFAKTLDRYDYAF